MIKCRALAENSIFVTAAGDILPCCFIYRGGPKLTAPLIRIVQDKNFESLVTGWDSPNPHHLCVTTCDDRQTTNPLHMSNFDKQWNNDKEKKRD